MQPNLSDLEALARRAGDILRRGCGQQMHVEHKGEIDLVTEYDHRSEALILGEIRSRFPGHHIITEESGVVEGNRDQVWYIDPLDGTVNYAHGVPLFSVSIAYEEQGQLKLGVVYDPMHDELFAAERGRGAWLNGKRLQVSNVQDMIQALLVTGFPYAIRTEPNNNLDRFGRLSKITQGVRRLGSAALDLGYVAAGRFDGYWEIHIQSYDIAAGLLIVQEAGGVVSKLDGSDDMLTPPCSVVAANAAIHPQLLEQLRV